MVRQEEEMLLAYGVSNRLPPSAQVPDDNLETSDIHWPIYHIIKTPQEEQGYVLVDNFNNIGDITGDFTGDNA
jgi:hypothetical protein